MIKATAYGLSNRLVRELGLDSNTVYWIVIPEKGRASLITEGGKIVEYLSVDKARKILGLDITQ